MSKKLSVRGWQTAERIANRRPFETHGAMHAEAVTGPEQRLMSPYPGWLRGDGAEALLRDSGKIDYVVFSYYTPVAWHTQERGWVVVSRNFSTTSTKHQGTARGGVGMSHDKRVEQVMLHYALSEAQGTLLSLVAATGGIFATKRQMRSAAVLERLGLAQYAFSGQLVLSEAGKKYTASWMEA